MTRHSRITTAVAVRKRETQARRTQDVGAGSSGEIARLEAPVAELMATNRRLELANASLQCQLDELECEEEGSGSSER
jgi:hypothetical protein